MFYQTLLLLLLLVLFLLLLLLLLLLRDSVFTYKTFSISNAF